MKIAIINGPNLNLLGIREPAIYGNTNFEHYLSELEKQYPEVTFSYFQSNIEGELIDRLHLMGFDYDGIIINAGAYTHTSVAIGDAIASINVPVIEVHISNVYAREDFRHTSFLAKHCVGVISGLGLLSYEAALLFFLRKKNHNS